MSEAIWSVLAEPRRREVLDVLRTGPCAVNDLVEIIGASQTNISKHLKVLREAKLVKVEVDAQRRIYSLDPGPMIDLDVWLEPYRQLWNAHLDALGRHLKKR